MEKFIITTTPTIEGHPIKEYLGTINVNEVIGTNFFSDFAASFTDVFGIIQALINVKWIRCMNLLKKE